LSWVEFLDEVKRCRVCRSYPKVRAVPDARPWNGCDPPDPRHNKEFPRKCRALFVSEAPPGGSGTFFWRDPGDRLRILLFRALQEAGKRIREGNEGLSDFKGYGYYLLPSFCYPCGVNDSGGTKNAKPSRSMIHHSATQHISRAIQMIDPQDVILLGESASVAGMSLGRRCFTTYWPHKRSGHWNDTVSTLRRALD
jgi:uracil-DNA glycosylase